MTTIYLIRHGETEWNRNGRWQGHADVPLTEQGRAQAQALARRLRAERQRFDQIYSSDLQRALETAQIIARAISPDQPVQALPSLREIDVGSWSGLTRAEIMARFPGALTDRPYPPDGESRAAFTERVGGALLGLAEQHPGQKLALVTHGGTVRAMVLFLQALQGLPADTIGLIGNTSITELRHDESGWRVVRFNDIAHVVEEQAPDMLAPQNEGSAV